jgi:S1-C subfamily serine protease
MKKLSKSVKFFFFIGLFSVNTVFATSKIAPETLRKVEKAIVTIDSRVSVSAYQDPGSWRGTGFITDKKDGFIVTNNHVVGGASIGTYFVTFHNGQQVQAKPIYYDLWQDYAILKINPSEIPSSAEQILFSKTLGEQNQNVFVIGSPESQEFSFHTGYVSTLYEISGIMPQCSYVVNLNSAGGPSGSPLLNNKSEAIGVVYGGSKTYTLALHGQYVQNALDSLKKATMPNRKHTGILCELYSLDRAVRHRHFPKEEMKEYIKKFPDARNKVVAVRSIIPGSPAENLMRPGDIIWEINGKPLGGSLAIFDSGMNNTLDDSVKLTIYRDGQKIGLIAKLYDINNNKIEHMISFAGAIFFQADDIASAKSGIPLGTLTIKNVQTGSSFSSIPVSYRQDYQNLYRLAVKSINEKDVNNFNELISVIPEAIKSKFISIRFKNYQPYFPTFNSFDNSFISAQEDLISDIVFDSIDNKPRILKYNNEVNEWEAEDIAIKTP